MDDQQEQERIDESLAEIVQAQLWQHDYDGTGGLEEYNENLLEQIRVDTFSEPTCTDEEDVVANLGDDFYAQFNDVGQGEAVREFTQGLVRSLQNEENESEQGLGGTKPNESEQGLGGTKPIRKVYGSYACSLQTEENESEQGLGGTKPIRKVYGPYARPCKCQHNRRKDQCKECGGSQICEHGRLRPRCKDCKGSQICKHGKDKAFCRDCKGSQICPHDKNRATCWDCGGTRFCMHGRYKRDCPECKQLKQMVLPSVPQDVEPEQGLGGFEGGTYTPHDLDAIDNQGSEVVIDSDEESMKQILSDVRRRPLKQRRNIKDFVESVNVATPGEPLQCQHGNTPPGDCKCWNGVCRHGIFKSSCRECGAVRFCKHGKYKTRCSQCKAPPDTNDDDNDNNDGGFGAPPPQKPRKQ